MSTNNEWLIPAALAVGSIMLFKQSGTAARLQQNLADLARRDEGWTQVVMLYSAVVIATFAIGYANKAARPALLSWYVL